MALLSSLSSSPCPPSPFLFNHFLHSSSCSSISRLCFTSFNSISAMPPSSPDVCAKHSLKIDTSLLTLVESFYEDELRAASSLRVRSFHNFSPDTFGLQDHMKYLADREFEALKERVSGTRAGFRRVSCINASLPESHVYSISNELCSACKFSAYGEDRVVVGTLDLNQCLSLPDEISGIKPEVIGSDVTRAYLSNVCVAKELQRNGLGYALLEKAKMVAHDWGMTDLYVHVAVNNEPARRLYVKSGFVYESDEPAWQARFLDRPRRLLLWTGLSRA
ncbi:uncharacterized protein LOC129320349 [Prosopis cineraria]|uniref:uncharacterized protein LOC129320349 n=1 Tax=Prosopis cineraria TaxID=364024 RepID=UPI00240FBC97|nr:uncharacterized protein LOC129320349 [Prosopis cineraria]